MREYKVLLKWNEWVSVMAHSAHSDEQFEYLFDAENNCVAKIALTEIAMVLIGNPNDAAKK